MSKEEDVRMGLLAAILDIQVEPDSAEAITEPRLLEALTNGPGFTPEERRLLWLSPAARNTYFAVKEGLVRGLGERLAAERLQLQLSAQAAGGGAHLLSVEGEDFTVIVQDHRQDAGIWVVTLRLKERAWRLIPPMTTLRLVDSGGLEWLSGRPGSTGEISATWQHKDISPRERLAVHSLAITPG